MRNVSQYESNLLTILLSHFRPGGSAESRALLIRRQKAPRCLSRNCVELIQQFLATGITEWAARQGWRKERFPDTDGTLVRAGRLWKRHPAEEISLSFSQHSVEWLMWLTSANMAAPSSSPFPADAKLTLGDQLLLFHTIRSHSGTLPLSGFLHVRQVQNHPLVWLYYSDILKDAAPEQLAASEFSPWLSPHNIWVFETLMHDLTQAIVRQARTVRTHLSPQDILTAGNHMHQTLEKFLNAINAAGRRDLGVCVLRAVRLVLDAVPQVAPWLSRADLSELRLADRAEVMRAGMALFHQMPVLQQWQRESLSVGFYDEDYQAAQFWKSLWEESQGDTTLQRVNQRLQDAAPLAGDAAQ